MTVDLSAASDLARIPLLVVVILAQAGVIAGWLRAVAPPSPLGVGVVAGGAGLAADVLAAFGRAADLAPLAAVLALAVIGTLVVQLARGVARTRLTESVSATLTLAVVVVAYATPLALVRQHSGTAAVVCYVAAVGIGVLLARLTDVVLARPRLAEGVDRGGLGIALGVLGGTAAAAGVGALIADVTALDGALLGCVIAFVAVLVDLAGCYGTAAGTCRGRVAAALGPLLGFAAAAPVGYVVATLLLS